MGLSYTYDGSPLGYDVPPTKATLPSRAELGSISIGGISPEDPTAALTLVGWKPFHVDESDCSQPRLFTGWVADRNIGRSFEQTQFVGADSRIHDTNISDLNAALSMRIIWDTDGNRPAEYLSARVAWLLGSSYLTGLLDDTGKVHDFGSTDMMDATDYRKSFPDAVLTDCNDRTGGVLNYFAFWDPTPASGSPRAGLFFDTLGATTYDCTISISNAGDDNGTTIFEPDHPARLQKTPEAVYSDVVVDYKNGSVHRYMASTETDFIRRGTTISRPHTGTAATASAQGDAYLNRHNAEVDRITTTVHVPSSVVGLIQAGMRMRCTFTHMPGYETGTSMRIVACSPAPVDDLADWYDVALELVAPQIAPPVTLHQVVVINSTGEEAMPGGFSGFGVQPNGGAPATMEWNGDGSGIGTYASAVPPVIQDTDGYTGTTGDWRSSGPIYSFTVPTGLLGTYRIGFEAVNIGTAWWPPDHTGAAGTHPPCPIATAYVPGHYPVNPTDGILNAGGTVTYDIMVNGSSVRTKVVVVPPYSVITGNQFPSTYMDEPGIVLADGDVVSITVTWNNVWDVANFWSALFTHAVFYMTMTAGGSTTGGDIIPPATSDTTTHTTNPTVTEDGVHGYAIGARWINTTTGEVFVLVDATTGAAVWVSTTSSGTGFVTNTLGGKEVLSTIAALGATHTLDLANGNGFDATLTANCTLTFAGATAGTLCSFMLLLRQNGTGGWTTTWPGSVVWAGGTAPTLSTTASTAAVLTFFTLDGGTTWYGFPTGASADVDAIHEVVMQTGTSSPPVPIWNSAGDDWVYSS